MNKNNLAIKIVNLSRNFKGKLAVDKLNLQVENGEIYAFLGPNGAGKSTTIKMLVTLLESDSGEIEIHGLNMKTDSASIRLITGVALQEASLDESQTGEEFLRLQGSLYGLSGDQITQRINDLIPLIDIGDSLKKQIKTYSGGMKRRLDLAASIIHNPKVLFLDEPTTGLDPISRNKVWQEINRLNKELGMTIFLTTQYLEEADQLADRVGIICNGKLAAEGTPKFLKESIGHDLIIAKIKNISTEQISQIESLDKVTKVEFSKEELRITTQDGASTIGKVAIILDGQNIAVESLTLRTTTLDDVFLKVTGNTLSQHNSIN